jgi:hypothetical protein
MSQFTSSPLQTQRQGQPLHRGVSAQQPSKHDHWAHNTGSRASGSIPTILRISAMKTRDRDDTTTEDWDPSPTKSYMTSFPSRLAIETTSTRSCNARALP